jgi:hypothetical protein
MGIGEILQQLDAADALRRTAARRIFLAAGNTSTIVPTSANPNTYLTANAVPLVFAFGVTSIRMIAMIAIALPPEAYKRFLRTVQRGREVFDGRVVWNVNSTARGGGVAEMLVSLFAYARGAGIDARWVVIAGNEEFFALTKRIHNFLHGSSGSA